MDCGFSNCTCQAHSKPSEADPSQVSGWTKGRFDILGRMPAPEQRERRFGPWTFYE